MIQLMEHFENDYRHQNSEAGRRRQWFIKAKNEQARREEISAESDDSMLTTAVVVTVATAAQISEFEMRLDVYESRLDAYEAKLDARDIAITKALVRNQEQYEALVALRNKLLDNAYELPDGRKVFKSVDGTSVYFQDGSEVPTEIITAGEIPDHFTKFEPIQQIGIDLSELKKEREALHEAQADNDQRRDGLSNAREKLDTARERIGEGDLTVDEIKDLDAEILDLMPKDDLPALPPSAAKHLATTNNAPAAKTAFTANANLPIPANPDNPASDPRLQL